MIRVDNPSACNPLLNTYLIVVNVPWLSVVLNLKQIFRLLVPNNPRTLVKPENFQFRIAERRLCEADSLTRSSVERFGPHIVL